MADLIAASPAKSDYAYVTLFTGDAYLPGAIALVRSLKMSGTTADVVVLHTGGVSEEALAQLAPLGARLVRTELLNVSQDFRERHERAKLHANAPFTKGGKPKFHTPFDNFCKLRLWQLTEYKKCVFIDADALVVRNIDRLFGYPQFSAAPNVYETVADFHRLNSGVFVAEPSQVTFDDMLAKLDVPDAFWRRTDQTFLETYFPQWHGLPVFFNTLQYVWFNLPQLWRWSSVHVVHYQYEKPWEADNPKADQLRPLIDLWKAYYTGENIPDIDSLADPDA